MTDREFILNALDRVRAKQASIYKRIQHAEGKRVISLILRYERIEDIKGVLSMNALVDILNNELFEIYTCNDKPVTYCGERVPAGSVTGWDIKWLLSLNEETVKQYPLFDCIISRNDNSTGRTRTAEVFNP